MEDNRYVCIEDYRTETYENKIIKSGTIVYKGENGWLFEKEEINYGYTPAICDIKYCLPQKHFKKFDINFFNVDTSEEEKILDTIADVWNEFSKLERQHPSEHNDFADGIHTLQNILAMRMMRKYRSDLFPIKK